MLERMSLPGPSPVADKPLTARFDGGRLSSDGGLPALREVERRLGIAEGLDRSGGSSRASARRLKVEWSGTGRSRPSRCRTEPISPSVWRSARRNTARSVSAVAIARWGNGPVASMGGEGGRPPE